MTLPLLWSAEVEARIRAEARNLDPQERPAHVQMCTRCVVTNQRPRIVFDGEGVCSACRHAERKRQGIDWEARGDALRYLLDRHRGNSGYDAIVPCSGGKDSAFVAHTLKHKYGMTPLCATWAPHIYTDIGWQNFQSFIHSGFDTVLAQPNGLLHRKLSRLAFEFYGDPFQPFAYGQLCWPMHVAAQNGVKLVFFGENGEAEYGGDPAANDKPCWDGDDWWRVYCKDAAVYNLINLGIDLGAISKDEAARASQFYGKPETDNPPEFHWLGYYLPWHPMENYYFACEHTGFEPNPERSESTYTRFASLDDKMDGLHYFMAYVKFGIGRCTSDAAQQCRNGDITRDEALLLVKKYDGEFPTRHLDECMGYLGMDREALDAAIERFRGDHVSLNRAA